MKENWLLFIKVAKKKKLMQMPKAGGMDLGHEVEKVGETEDEKSEDEAPVENLNHF